MHCRNCILWGAPQPKVPRAPRMVVPAQGEHEVAEKEEEEEEEEEKDG